MAEKKAWVPPEQYWKERYLAERGYSKETWKAKKASRRAEGRFYDRKNPTAKRAYYKSKVKKDGKTPGYISKGGSAAGGAAGTFLGSAYGGPVGGALGGAVGSFLGGKIGHLVEQITGFGDYKVASNSIMQGGCKPISIVNSSNKGGTIIRHREYIGDILATTAFTTQTFVVNPGLLTSQGCFPWLSSIANNYEQYKMRGCIFEYSSTSSDALLSSATSTALGTVNMATQYDVTDPVFTDKRSMLNHEWANSRKPSQSFIHPIECKKSWTPNTAYFTRPAAVPNGSDPARFDFCKFTIATEGMQAAGGVLGELYVVYEIELLKQQFTNSALTDHFRLGSVTNVAPLGTAVLGSNLANGGTLGGVINGAGTAYSFPPLLGSGDFLLEVSWAGVSTLTVSPGATLTNCTALPLFCNNSATVNSNLGDTTGIAIYRTILRITSQGAAITFGAGGTLPNAIVCADLFVTQVTNTLV